MIVVDASVILELLLATPACAGIEERILAPGVTLHTPHLLDLEVTQVLRRYCLSGVIPAERGRQALGDLIDLPMERYRHDLFLTRIWKLRGNLTAYDAVYVALAEALPAPLVTRDARLAAAGHDAAIELI